MLPLDFQDRNVYTKLGDVIDLNNKKTNEIFMKNKIFDNHLAETQIILNENKENKKYSIGKNFIK